MMYRSKHLPYYVFLLGIILLSTGFNIIQNQEIKVLREQTIMYRVLFEYLYFKLENIEKNKITDDISV